MKENSYFNGTTIELKRSQIHLSGYNPRKMSDEGKKQLKRSIKRYGVVGGIVVNKQTGFTVVGGHQKISILDELNKYPANDYILKVELIDVDEKTEKSLNIALNNPNVGGEWDYDKLRELIPDIDYKDAGLTDADLSMIGVDFILQTEGENNIASQLDEMMKPIDELNEAEKVERTAERANKIAHMKEVKEQVKNDAMKKASQMEAYVTLSFETIEAKMEFLERFGYDPYIKIIKGEDFDNKCEAIIE